MCVVSGTGVWEFGVVGGSSLVVGFLREVVRKVVERYLR